LRAQVRFKLRDLLADEWLADTDFTRSSREAATLNYAHEHTHGVEPIHGLTLVHPLLE
jgi:hypothetical protein